MVKNIIFDLNGVFIRSPKLSDRFKNDFNVDIDEFLSALKEIMDKIRRPDAGDFFKYWKPYFVKWGVILNKLEFSDYWFKAEKEDALMVSLAKKLKESNFSLFILSNNFQERAKYYSKNFSWLAEIFDKVYYSWQTGFVKPDINCFKLIIHEYNLNPIECLYFDDSDKNVELAKSLGMQAYLFKDKDQVEKIIKELNK